MRIVRQMPKVYFSALFIIGAGLVALIVAIAAGHISATAVLPDLEAIPESTYATNSTSANCRYGVSALNSDQVPWVTTLGTGWYINFIASPYNTLPANNAEFVHVIRVSQDRTVSGTYLPTYTITPPLTNGGLGNAIDLHPGALWLVGNEPDVADVQDDTFPAVYARAYHDVYHYIKQRDPSAQVGIGGLSMMTPGRRQYLDIVWNTYAAEYGIPMPVDVWNFHLYILSEIRPWDGGRGDGQVALGTDPNLAKHAPFAADPALCPLNQVYCRAEHDSLSIFIDQIVGVRTWMKAHGQQNKPLILSEFSLLYPFVDFDDPVNPTHCFLQDELGGCFTAARVNNFMEATFNYLETAVDTTIGYPNDNYRLVQQWLWFSLVTEPEGSGGSSSLLKQNYRDFSPGNINAFNEVGSNMYDEVSAQSLAVNLFAGQAHSVVTQTTPLMPTADVPLTVAFHNNGNSPINQAFQVTFYANAALTQVIDSTIVNEIIEGCARRTYTASVIWHDRPAGTYRYWAKIDSGDAIFEPGGDNVTQGIVLIDPQSIYLPVITRANP